MNDMSDDQKIEMRNDLGIGDTGIDVLIQKSYEILGLITFLTTGEKETRAWTFRSGSSAPECAGRIHTDFERGFIRAETIRWDQLLEFGSYVKAREAGAVRSEGKDYCPQDGDVLEFRFNV